MQFIPPIINAFIAPETHCINGKNIDINHEILMMMDDAMLSLQISPNLIEINIYFSCLIELKSLSTERIHAIPFLRERNNDSGQLMSDAFLDRNVLGRSTNTATICSIHVCVC